MKILPAHKTGAALLLVAALLCASCEEALQTYLNELRDFTFTAEDLTAEAAVKDAPAGSFSAGGGAEPLIYKLVSGEGDADNGFFAVAGTSLFIAAEALEPGLYRFRARVEDGEGAALEGAFTLTVYGEGDGPGDPDGPDGPDVPPGDSVPVSRVRLDRTQLNMPLGGTAELRAEISPDNATNRGLSWSSSNEAVVTVEDGTLTAQGPGTARITVRTGDGNRAAYCTVRVWDHFRSLAAMSAWLGGLPANSPAAPYYVMLSDIALSERSGGGGLKPLFPALAGRYVALNLDACSGATIGWDDLQQEGGATSTAGKDKVVQVILPASTTHIGYYSFENCTALRSVVIPASVRAIGMYAFRGCTALESVTVLAETPPQKGNAYMGWFPATGVTIYVPAASVADYKAAEGWDYYAANIRALE
ncbi:MAG: leucine-rich repeat protein [Spirochaetaceae bacterium]|jgi:hypothetical protein|nr:leucine-rich repeat protein [Spirochaetaceae bacterium]